MLFFKNKMAVPNVRKLNRKIKKINKIRTHYLDYCEIITNDANSFTETMMKVHDEMIDAIKLSREVEKNFDDVYTKYMDADDEDIDEEEEEEENPNEIDLADIIGDEYDDDEEDDDDEEETDSDDEEIEEDDDIDSDSDHTCSCGCDHDDDEDGEETDSDIVKDVDKNGSWMRIFRGDSAKAIANTSYAFLPVNETSDKLDDAFKNIGYEILDSEGNTHIYKKNNNIVNVDYNDINEAVAAELILPLNVIPHSNPCRKIYNDVSDNGFLFPVIDNNNNINASTSDTISTWYICGCGRGMNIRNDDVLLLNIDINKKKKNVTIRYMRSFYLDQETRDSIIK